MDCNNFFVSCERLFRPDLLGKPVAVLSSNDGCIVARSQEVKALGVPMGMPLFQAKQLVDMREVTLFSSNFTLYRDISSRVMQTLAAEVGDTEVYSIDEAFFRLPAATTSSEIAALRAEITRLTGIPVSIGVGESKTIAKIASELGKQGSGAVVVLGAARSAMIGDYPCQEVWNIGRATARVLKENNITTVAELTATDRSFFITQFGVAGARLYDELSGVAVYPVTDTTKTLRQSLTSSRSFAKTTTALADMESAITYHLEQVGEKLRRDGLYTARVAVELLPSRHGDFAFQAARFVVECVPPTQSTQTLVRMVLPAVREHYQSGVPYKKAGVTVSALTIAACVQEDLWQTASSTSTHFATLDAATDSINRRFGQGTLRSAAVVGNGSLASATLRSPAYTTSWRDIPTVH